MPSSGLLDFLHLSYSVSLSRPRRELTDPSRLRCPFPRLCRRRSPEWPRSLARCKHRMAWPARRISLWSSARPCLKLDLLAPRRHGRPPYPISRNPQAALSHPGQHTVVRCFPFLSETWPCLAVLSAGWGGQPSQLAEAPPPGAPVGPSGVSLPCALVGHIVRLLISLPFSPSSLDDQGVLPWGRRTVTHLVCDLRT